MSLTSLILVFLMNWLILFFISLPFGVDVPEVQKSGNAKSAPNNPNLKLKLLISFIISFLPTFLIYLLIKKNILSDLLLN